MLDFISLVSVSSTKSEILIEKIKELMMNCRINITKRKICMFRGSQLDERREMVFRDAIEMMLLSQYMSNVHATGYYILNC